MKAVLISPFRYASPLFASVLVALAFANASSAQQQDIESLLVQIAETIDPAGQANYQVRVGISWGLRFDNAKITPPGKTEPLDGNCQLGGRFCATDSWAIDVGSYDEALDYVTGDWRIDIPDFFTIPIPGRPDRSAAYRVAIEPSPLNGMARSTGSLQLPTATARPGEWIPGEITYPNGEPSLGSILLVDLEPRVSEGFVYFYPNPNNGKNYFSSLRQTSTYGDDFENSSRYTTGADGRQNFEVSFTPAGQFLPAQLELSLVSASLLGEFEAELVSTNGYNPIDLRTELRFRYEDSVRTVLTIVPEPSTCASFIVCALLCCGKRRVM